MLVARFRCRSLDDDSGPGYRRPVTGTCSQLIGTKDGVDGANDANRWGVVSAVAVVLFCVGEPRRLGVSEDGLEELAINGLERPGNLRADGETLATALKLPTVHPDAPHVT